ncbi:hypothetical protein [Mycoplasmoides gallisepticum]|nr:hypothetical protein [Mycoplasmoides gallisepticum]ULH61958.1 hypothetical protein MHC98_02370 [Mycoplasmoides gallisepticum]WGG23623.1 hypothetical protein P0D30_02390 [Mycoplasmoides gallisepticum]
MFSKKKKKKKKKFLGVLGFGAGLIDENKHDLLLTELYIFFFDEYLFI